MSERPTLFDYSERYAHTPGHRRADTSKAAAKAMRGRDKPLRQKTLEVLKSSGPMTADEVAAFLGESVLSIRPRVAQLRRLALITDSGYRRSNISGLKAIVWAVSEQTSKG